MVATDCLTEFEFRKTTEYRLFTREIITLSQKLSISKNSLALGFEIGKTYLENSTALFDQKRLGQFFRVRELEIAHASLFLASKMLESDISCPMVSNMV